MILNSLLTLCGCCAAVTLATPLSLLAENQIPEDCKIGGFFIGCQAYTFNHFSVFEAIEKTASAGGKVIEFYPGQKLSKEEPTVSWDHNASAETIQKVKEKLAASKVTAVNYGVVDIPKDEAAARKVFEFAKALGLYAVTTESVDAIDTIEKLVKEYDIKVAFHDHPKQANNPGYKMWDPNYVMSVIKDRDARIGSGADTGHWVRSGLDPVECLKKLEGRILGFHLKDALEKGNRGARDVPLGEGTAEYGAVLAELKRQGYRGVTGIEYEHDSPELDQDVAKCVAFVEKTAKSLGG